MTKQGNEARLPQPSARRRCRWCDREIQYHAALGWVHTTAPFHLCRNPKPGSPEDGMAEPDEEAANEHTPTSQKG